MSLTLTRKKIVIVFGIIFVAGSLLYVFNGGVKKKMVANKGDKIAAQYANAASNEQKQIFSQQISNKKIDPNNPNDIQRIQNDQKITDQMAAELNKALSAPI
ncbi:MAG: hypothetical protein JWS12_474 [Candidatus Saccharibacteria bacterium]|nr:hypothetical protein [Candidatus Saccharibacteria bacterium]